MALNLVCVQPFSGLVKGNQISDAVAAASYWASRPIYFVQVADLAVPPTWQNQTGAPVAGNLTCQAANVDGNALIVGSNGGGTNYIYLSVDRGRTWTALTPMGSRNWAGVAISSNGLVIAGVANNGNVYVSTDGGATVGTTAVSGASNLTQIAMSGDGAKVLAADNGQGKFYLSTNGGSPSFSQVFSAGASTTGHVAISRDGSAQIINYNTGGAAGVLLSTNNFGANTDINPGGNVVGNTTLLNSNGRIIYLATNGGQIKRSVDQGATFTNLSAPHQMGIGGVSDDGATIIMTDLNTNLTYLSDDFGVTQVSQTPPGALSSSGGVVSGDKTLGMISDNAGAIYTFASP